MTAFALMDFFEDLDPFFLTYAALEYVGDTAFVRLVVDDGVGTCPAFDLPGDELVRWEFVVGEVGEEGLGPWRSFFNDEDLDGFRLA